MKLMRTTSILAGLLLAVASFSSAACKKEDDKKKNTKKNVKKAPTTPDTNKKGTAPKVVEKQAKKTAPDPAAGSGDGYTIKIDRAFKVGFKYKMTSVGKRDMKVLANGKPGPGSGVMAWEYEAEVTIKAVDAAGQATAEDHKVVKFDITMNGKKSTPLAKDKVIVATVKGDDEVFTVDGAAADKQTAGLLGQIISLEKQSGGASQDDIFGSKDKKKIGDSWDVNKEMLVKDFGSDMKDAALVLKAQNVQGKVTLVSAGEMNGAKGLNFKIDLKMKDVAPKMGPVKPTVGTIDVTMQGWLPVDTAAVDSMKLNKKMVMHVEGTAGPVKVVVDMTQSADETKIAIK